MTGDFDSDGIADLQEVGALGAGIHTLGMTGGRALTPGIYWVRLRQDGALATTRASLIR